MRWTESFRHCWKWFQRHSKGYIRFPTLELTALYRGCDLSNSGRKINCILESITASDKLVVLIWDGFNFLYSETVNFPKCQLCWITFTVDLCIIDKGLPLGTTLLYMLPRIDRYKHYNFHLWLQVNLSHTSHPLPGWCIDFGRVLAKSTVKQPCRYYGIT